MRDAVVRAAADCILGRDSRMHEIVDADGHLVEGMTFMSEALERFADHVRLEPDDESGVALFIEGRRYPQSRGPGRGVTTQHSTCHEQGIDPSSVAGVLRDANREGIGTMVLYPSLALGVPGFVDPAFAGEFAEHYNRHAAAWCSDSGHRLRAVAVVPLEDVPRAIAVMESAKALGLVGVCVPPALRERNLDHPDLDPFFAAAEALDLAVGVHGAPGLHLPKIGVDRFDNYIQVHCVSFPFDQMAAMTALVSGGVLERHPRLRVAFLEAGIGWLPFFLDRLDEHFEKRGDWIADGWKRPPREYLARGQIFATCEPEESLLPAAAEILGAEHIMYASDYPHWDSEFPHSTRPIRERVDLSEPARAAILGGTARRFYGLG